MSDEFINPFGSQKPSKKVEISKSPIPPPKLPKPEKKEKKETKPKPKPEKKETKEKTTRVQMVKESKETLEKLDRIEDFLKQITPNMETISERIENSIINNNKKLTLMFKSKQTDVKEKDGFIMRKSYENITYQDLEKLGLTYNDLGWEVTKKLMKAKGIKRSSKENIANIRVKLLNSDNKLLSKKED